MQKTAGVTVLYNPNAEITSNVLTYINQVDTLYIVDNSENEVKYIIDSLKQYNNVIFIDNTGNIGIAAAMNKAAFRAIEDGHDFLLTMDQDSTISNNLVSSMLKEFEKDKEIGIIAPHVVHVVNPKKPFNGGLEKIIIAMTSGCIINLSAFQETGSFLEKLFIDYVDNEYCLRIQSAGFKVMQLNSVFLYHNLGETEPRRFLTAKVFPTNHSPLRWYYRTRNRLYVYERYRKKYPGYIIFDLKVFLKDFLKILFYEKNKIKKIKMIFLGVVDFRRKKFGKLV